jgi:hypothetical protein
MGRHGRVFLSSKLHPWVAHITSRRGQGYTPFQQLHAEGYFAGRIGKPVYSVEIRGEFVHSVPFLNARVEYLTEKGLREIGELPDPREELLLGLEAAIASLGEDPRLSEEEKRQKIDWLQQIVDAGRDLTVEGIKALWRGDIQP